MKKGKSAEAPDDFSAQGLLNKGMDKAKELSKDEITGEVDPTLKYMDKIVDIIKAAEPLIKMAVAGFQGAMQKNQGQNPNTMASIQPPDGWAAMSPLDRHKHKFSKPEWYQAGCEYELMRKGQPPMRNVSPPQMDIAMDPRSALLAQNRAQERQPFFVPESHRAPAAPAMSDEAFPVVDMNTPEPVEQKGPSPEEKRIVEQTAVAVVSAQMEQYLNMAIGFINKMDMDEFKKKLPTADKLIRKYRVMLNMIPQDIRTSIKNTPTENLIKVFVEQCPEKWDYIVKEKKHDDVVLLFNSLKNEM